MAALHKGAVAVKWHQGDLRAERQCLKQIGDFPRNRNFCKEDDGKDFSGRQRRAEAEHRANGIGSNERLLRRNVEAPFGFGYVEHVEGRLVSVDEKIGTGLEKTVEVDAELGQQLREHGELGDEFIAA